MRRPWSYWCPANRAWLVLGVSLALGAAAFWLKLGPVASTSSEISRLEHRLVQLTRKKARSEQSAQAVGQPSVEGLWPAKEDAEASAIIQARIADIATSANISLRSITPLPKQTAGPFSLFVMNVEFEAPYDQFVLFVGELEHQDNLLKIQNAHTRVLRGGDTSAPYPTVHSQITIAAPMMRPAQKEQL